MHPKSIDFPAFRSRTLFVALIVAGHALIIYALLSGIVAQVAAKLPDALTTVLIPDRPRTYSPPARLHLTATPARILPDSPPRKQFDFQTPPDDAAPPSTGPAAQPADTSPPREPPLVLMGHNRLPDTEDFYPAAARRGGIEGSTQVRVCVDEHGKPIAAPRVERSSGSALLDTGAVAVARAGRYARALRGGRPVPNCYGFRIEFRLK